MFSLQQEEFSATGKSSQGKKYALLCAIPLLCAAIGTIGFLASDRPDAKDSIISFDLGCIKEHGMIADCEVRDHDHTVQGDISKAVTKFQAVGMTKLRATAMASSQGPGIQMQLSRRAALQQAAGAAVLGAALPAFAEESTFSTMGGLLEPYVDAQRGFKLYRPSGWNKFDVDPGVFDVKFQDIIEQETVVQVSTSPVFNSTSVEALGEVGVAGQKLATSRKAELVSAVSRTVGDVVVYQFDLKGEQFHELIALSINKGKLYRLSAVTSNKKWDKRKQLYQNIVNSFVPQGF